jgi:serine-type D-Ala-D-Ala endopeptidase (penicillin-binding protein 7)
MSLWLKVVMMMFVFGCGCLSFTHAPAAEKRDKAVVQKTPVKTAKSKPVAVKAKQYAKNTRNSRKMKVSAVATPTVAAPVQNPGKLAVKSGAALVIEQYNGDELFQKNADQVVPIASLTKLMTAMVVLDSAPLLEAPITITDDDVDYLRGSRSRLPVGTIISRETALLLALMSSENRAAHALGRHYPGGMPAFLSAMNNKAQQLGMLHSRFEDPTGLTSNNVSTAHDLAKMVGAAHSYQLIRKYTTTTEAKIDVGGHEVTYCNTNPLVKSTTWDVGLSKTGYISEAGKCLVMQARLAEKAVVIVLLDSEGSMTRVGDANRIKQWMERVYTSKKPSIQTAATQKSGRSPS